MPGIGIITLAEADATKIPASFYMMGFIIKTWSLAEGLSHPKYSSKILYGNSSKQKKIQKVVLDPLQQNEEMRTVEEEVVQQTNNQDTNEGNKETDEKLTIDSNDSIKITCNTTEGSEQWLDASQTSSVEKKSKNKGNEITKTKGTRIERKEPNWKGKDYLPYRGLTYRENSK
ncbi:hypothetical protein CHS0354_029525 [Potamilus streckersoni]|uniref:Uncharacterized protein n=1 Tax=Potamilus streckersoni TaxID=2493646 RepID=A0AAE0W573_9BIVA|nr:hypothetical protein CHS0354_029525 [Potamilus streckersoni]